MNINPFSDNADETSFEQGLPINQVAKNAVKTTSAQADAQMKAANKAIVDQLYGPSTPPGQDKGTDEANPQASDVSNVSHSSNKQAGSNTNTNTNQTPEDQAKMEKIRHELFGNYSQTFKAAAVNGAQNIITGVDMEMDRERKKREQEEMQRKQEEEEEEKRKEEEKEQAEQEFATPAGKKAGAIFGKKQQEPFALRLAKTKTEINRGTIG